MTPSEVLIAARALIDTPEKWWRGESRRDDDSAVACAQNAIYRAWEFTHDEFSSFTDALRFLQTVTGEADIPAWNDAPERTHAEVMDAFDRAIALARDAETVANTPQ